MYRISSQMRLTLTQHKVLKSFFPFYPPQREFNSGVFECYLSLSVISLDNVPPCSPAHFLLYLAAVRAEQVV